MHCMRAYALYTKDTGAISGVYNTYRLDSDRSLIMLIDSLVKELTRRCAS